MKKDSKFIIKTAGGTYEIVRKARNQKPKMELEKIELTPEYLDDLACEEPMTATEERINQEGNEPSPEVTEDTDPEYLIISLSQDKFLKAIGDGMTTDHNEAYVFSTEQVQKLLKESNDYIPVPLGNGRIEALSNVFNAIEQRKTVDRKVKRKENIFNGLLKLALAIWIFMMIYWFVGFIIGLFS